MYVSLSVCVCLSVEALAPKRLDFFRRHSEFEVGQQHANAMFFFNFLKKTHLVMSQPPFCKMCAGTVTPSILIENKIFVFQHIVHRKVERGIRFEPFPVITSIQNGR